jgi:hypothetical protein
MNVRFDSVTNTFLRMLMWELTKLVGISSQLWQ